MRNATGRRILVPAGPEAAAQARVRVVRAAPVETEKIAAFRRGFVLKLDVIHKPEWAAPVTALTIAQGSRDVVHVPSAEYKPVGRPYACLAHHEADERRAPWEVLIVGGRAPGGRQGRLGGAEPRHGRPVLGQDRELARVT